MPSERVTNEQADLMARCEYDPSVADAAWKNILFLTDGPSPMDPRLQHVWQATLLREIRTFARAARDDAR